MYTLNIGHKLFSTESKLGNQDTLRSKQHFEVNFYYKILM